MAYPRECSWQLREMCTLLLLGGVWYTCLLGLLVYSVKSAISLLAFCIHVLSIIESRVFFSNYYCLFLPSVSSKFLIFHFALSLIIHVLQHFISL